MVMQITFILTNDHMTLMGEYQSKSACKNNQLP